MNDGERRRALTKFAKEGARTQPPVFVGRDKVVEDIATAANIAHDKWLSGAIDAKDPGLTRIVQGAPGVGKTSLLRHLQERWAGGPEDGHPIAVRISASALNSPTEMQRRLRGQFPRTIMETWGETLVQGLLKMAPGGAADALGPAVEQATRALVDKVSAPLPTAVVVMVDETQRVEPYSDAATTLQNLHEGAFGDIPVLPVFAGLGYLHSHLQQKGIKISRYSDDTRCVHTLWGLADQDSKRFFGEWLRHFGVEATGSEFAQWSATLFWDAQGWPMHINGFLGALAEELAQSGDPATLASADLDTVRRVAANARAAYYNGRYGEAVLANVRWAGRAMAALASVGACLEEDATAIIRDAGPTDGDAPALFSALVERGFLQREGTQLTFVCPIPTLLSHAAVAAMKQPDVHKASSVGDVDKLRRLVAGGGDIEDRDALGRTPLAVAAECRWADVAGALV